MDATPAYVYLRDWAAVDRLGNHVESYLPPVPVGVLVAPGAASALGYSRPEGVRVDLTLHFPKSWRRSLRGAKVRLGGIWGGEYAVIGNPMPYDPRLVPDTFGEYYLPVEVVAYDG